MISAADAQDWSPRGRVLPHPGGLAGTSELHVDEQEIADPLVEQLRHIDLSDVSKEWWCLRASPSIEGAEEELYVRGRTVVWSRGAHSRWLTLRTFTSEYPVLLASWSVFHSSPSLHQLPFTDADSAFEGVCIVDSHNVSIFAADGRDYITSIQFPVASLWPTKVGILLEMESSVNPNSDMTTMQLPLLYSVQHPYDDIKPVLTKHGALIGAMVESSQRVVFTHDEPSICMLFNAATGLHSVWSVRKATLQESFAPGRDDNSYSVDSMFRYSVASSMSPLDAIAASPIASASPVTKSDSRRHSMVSHLSHLATSPIPRGSASRRHSMYSSRHSIARDSPGKRSSLVDSLGGGMSFSSRRESIDCRSPLGSVAPEGPLHPLFPEICLDHLWSETEKVGSSGNGASRVFLTKDLVGQSRLCYFVPTRQELCMVRLDMTNQNEQLIFGSTYTLPARDAAPLVDLPMFLMLELTGGVALYSGPQLISKVFIPGVSAPQVPSLSSHSLLSSSSAASPLSTHSDNSFKYRRSSLRAECTLDVSYFGDTSCILSPVPRASLPGTCLASSEPRVSEIVKLRDPTSRRVTLEYNTGHMLRISLPEMHTSLLVRRCIGALGSVLKRDIAMQLLVKWYCARNAPGSQDITAHAEWQLFLAALLGLLGYEVDKLRLLTGIGGDINSVPQEKRKKKSDAGTQEDWTWLVSSYHQEMSDMCTLLGLECPAMNLNQSSENDGQMNTAAPLFAQLPLILSSLHLLYEEMKLEVLSAPYLAWLAQLLHLLASDLRLSLYIDLYWRDFPLLCRPYQPKESQLSESDVAKLSGVDQSSPPNILTHLHTLLSCSLEQPPAFPYLPVINPITRDVVQLTGLLTTGLKDPGVSLNSFLRFLGPSSNRPHPTLSEPNVSSNCSLAERAVSLMVHRGITREKLEQLPASVALLMLAAVSGCRQNPPPDWNEASYSLVGREDLATLCRAQPDMQQPQQSAEPTSPTVNTEAASEEVEDGMEQLDNEVLSLRFPKDHRVASVRRMLQSARPVRIAVTQRPEVSDHDYIEEQERQLYALCTRTMALPVGRGMFTLGSVKPVVLEPLPVPKLCLTGRSLARGTTIDLSHIEVVPNMNLWPLFHNGVAAGLRVCPTAPGIDSTWIAYNKQKGSADSQTEHAGFLMALGLNGHLSSLNNFKIYEYLQKCHEMTSVGLLLGIAASKRGSSDQETSQTIRTICLHIEAMLPPTSLELNIAQNVQVAALLGLGLLYQGSGHRHITEVLLSEIGRPPGPEMENCVDRESYSLAAGLALGLVVLGQGSAQLDDLRDLAIPDTLHHYMVGGHARQLGGSQRDKYRTPSYQIREGDAVNVHVTCPGATLALGMLYFRTGNEAVAGWMQAPDTQYLLDFVRPDFLLLRVLARGLILWDSIIPSREWVESNVPTSIKPFALAKPQPGSDPALDLETMNQAYCNILAGACMALGLRFAGSANNEAFETLLHYAHQFTSLLGKSVAELAGKSTVEACTNVIVLSLAMVMAGTGELEVLRLCRLLRSRVGPSHAVVTYGSHVATHMALGLLFLGGGRYTLSTSAPAVAALLCACFPKFPTHSNDNRYHLQAFRHLYVLAAEQRLLLPRCVDSKMCDYAQLRVVYLDTPWYRDQQVKLRAPCLLPESHLIKEVHVEDERYWPIVFERGRNWGQLTRLLEGSHCLPVKKKAGCLSYTQDPLGFRTLFAQSLTSETAICWSAKLESILAFSSYDPLVDFARLFLPSLSKEGLKEKSMKEQLRALTYECCVQDKPMVLAIVMAFMQGVQEVREGRPQSLTLWQIKLLWQVAPLLASHPATFLPLVSGEMATAMHTNTKVALDQQEQALSSLLVQYCSGHLHQSDSDKLSSLLAAYLTFYNIPSPQILQGLRQPMNPLSLMMQGLPKATAAKLAQWIKK